MAVITSAAIAGTAITAPIIAAGIGAATTAVTAGMSFSRAKQMRDDMDDANKEAAKAMEKAREKLEVNVYDKLGINKDIYEDQKDRFSATAKEAMQAGVESERGGPATAGRVLLAANEAQSGITSAMNQDLQQLAMLSAQEDARNRDIGVQLDLEEVAGAQLAAANAQELGAQATQQGFEGVTSLGSQFAEAVPLFQKTDSAKAFGDINKSLGKKLDLSQSDIQKNIANVGMLDGYDFSKTSRMTPEQFAEFMSGVNADTLKKINFALPSNAKAFKPGYDPTAKSSQFGLNVFQNPTLAPFIGR